MNLTHFLLGQNEMIVYSITITVKKSVVSEWLTWMTNEHIPEVMATGCFTGYEFMKMIIPTLSSDEVLYLIQYKSTSIDDYYRYAEYHSPNLQLKYQQKFPGKSKTSRFVAELVE